MRYTKDTFIEKANIAHNNKYTYNIANFTTISDKYDIICPIHGKFNQVGYAHIGKKQGCPTCGRIKVNKKNTKNDFLKLATKKHNNIYDYSKVKYVNRNTKVEIICNTHGSFWQAATHHIRGRGYPLCNKNFNAYRKSYYKNKKTIFYILYLPKSGKYKIGITSRQINERYKQEGTSYKIIFEQHFFNGEDAWTLEKLLLKNLHQYKYKGSKIFKHTSNSEILIKNPINYAQEALWKMNKKIPPKNL